MGGPPVGAAPYVARPASWLDLEGPVVSSACHVVVERDGARLLAGVFHPIRRPPPSSRKRSAGFGPGRSLKCKAVSPQ